ncbi:hypothetical protein [Paenibacillus tengchongensis]|uniref:hypothetical protein n=1 Tax=Paenibacillus tengchongensis TaxID=2608684 RepID=UPI00124CEFDB|nr:hypothetical protein [Paenibacillus tengchongensis]
MRYRRSLPIISAALVLTLALTACAGNSGAQAPSETAAPEIPAQTASPTASPGPSLAPSPSPAAETEVIRDTGTYVGQIDNHSVEIETEAGPTAFELGAGTENAPESLEMDDPVEFEYVEKAVEGDDSVVQRVLSKLVKAGEDTGGTVALPETKAFKLTLEGMEEEKTATLAQGTGYALYVFDIFDFDAAAGRLSMKVDPEYYAEITKLPADYSLDALAEEGRKELAGVGQVSELNQNQRDERMKGLKLYLTAVKSGLTRQYIVKELDGQGYLIKLNIPQREASEGFGPHVYASINSIVNQ